MKEEWEMSETERILFRKNEHQATTIYILTEALEEFHKWHIKNKELLKDIPVSKIPNFRK